MPKRTPTGEPPSKRLVDLHDSFLADIPDDKFMSGGKQETLYKDENFRLDCQGKTTESEKNPVQRNNLQIQINHETKEKVLKVLKKKTGGTVSTVEWDPMHETKPEEFRTGFATSFGSQEKYMLPEPNPEQKPQPKSDKSPKKNN
ncbi:hypothetical protein BC938DRAFT_478326 [Jimgerdemannia flammicorona]|uniref:Uncharacterized protein n=1 Tax=Jimgerdemannia flammicorona TaxID=994334 RepID=A0A433QN19_9FUNG|nr:hypothetical protein BC938DRAFT_478326 [Jimgerdemannia flammicorona]